MNIPRPVNDQVLDVDLSSGRIRRIEISEKIRSDYLGGKGLALKLLHTHVTPGIDPFSEGNALVFATGPTAGTPSPAGGRFVVAGKSPLTGIFGSSYAGGRFGLSLKRAGWDAVMIRGKAESPVYLRIQNDNISIEDASNLWGMDTVDTQAAMKSEGDWAVIGPAGENRVRYAVVAAGRRVAGRCGLGAVMGSKNLKGLVARGDRRFAPADPIGYEKALKIARKKVQSHAMTASKLREYGTAQNVSVYGKAGIMPVRNFSRTRFDQADAISGAAIRKHHAEKNHGCTGCPIQCGISGTFGGKHRIAPQYETIGLMGANLMIGDIVQIARWNETLDRLGMDSISTGGVIGFVMELAERGMIEAPLAFGMADGIDTALENIAFRRGLGDDMAEGVRRMAEKYGGTEFAIHVKGLEMAAYDPRGCTGQGLGYATAANGANHLSGSTHAIEAESYLSPHGTRGKAHFVRFMQDLNEGVNSAIFCIQTQYPFLEENPAYKYTPMWLMRAFMGTFPAAAVATADLSDYAGLLSGLLGRRITKRDFYTIGERIFNLERVMNMNEGIGRTDDTLPPRLLNEVREDGWPPIDLDAMLETYYQLRGWDASGHPKSETLNRLGLSLQEG